MSIPILLTPVNARRFEIIHHFLMQASCVLFLRASNIARALNLRIE